MASEYRLILKHADEPGYTPDIACYMRYGGYEALKKALSVPPKTLPDGKTLSGPEKLREEVRMAGLRGRGGAGFSCGLKWSFVDRKSGKPIYLICNADESEPGTFKDRQIIHKDPHQLLEGMIISCWANDVSLAYIYIRGEMPEGARVLNRAIQEAKAKGFLGKNVLGSGHVKRTGCYEVEVGKVTLGELIFHENFGQGLREPEPGRPPRKLKAIIPGGSSAKVFKAGEKFRLKRKGPDGQMAAVDVDLLDLPYDFDSLQQAGSMSGSGAIIVMGDTTDLVEALSNIAEFYAHESCGQCTPCREGSLWMAKALHRLTHGHGRKQDADYLLHIAQNIQGRTICLFGEACAWPVLSFVKKFKDEFEAKGAPDEERRAKKAKGAGSSSEMELAASPQH